MRIRSNSFVLLALVACCGAAQAQGTLPSPLSTDMVPDRLVQAANPGHASERQPVSFAWPIAARSALESPQAFVHESREFLATVDGAQLRKGYAIDTTAPGAVIRISPSADAHTTALTLDQIEVGKNGRKLPGAQALDRAATAEQMRQAGAPFPEGTLAFRVRPELGAGRITLQAGKANGRFLVHVYEPESPVRLYLGSDRDSHIAGNRLVLSGRLVDGDRTIATGRIGGLITAPDSRTYPVDFRTLGDGQAVAEADLPAEASLLPGLWEVHAFVSVDRPAGRALRDAKIAVAVAAPTARLAGDYRVETADGGLKVFFEVEAASEGRYEVGAVLYGSDSAGQPRPFAVGRSAAWLTAGNGELTLHFGADLLGKGLSAPYELRQLSLTDQSRLGRLEYRELGPRNVGVAGPAVAAGTSPGIGLDPER